MSFSITNPNLATALSGISFTDTLPAGLTATNGVTPICGGSLAITGGNLLTFTGGSLAANSTCTFSVTVTGATAGEKLNTTSAVSSIEGGVGNTASAGLVVTNQVARIDLTKQVSDSNSSGSVWTQFLATEAGNDVFYRFSVYNAGDVALTSISISDPDLAGEGSCVWPASLLPGETATCVIGPITAIAGLHENTATASGSFNSATYTSEPSTAAYATAELTLSKSAAETSFNAAGDVLHYSYLVTNTGAAALPGPVEVHDDKATDEACPAVTTVGDLDEYFDPGESMVCTATYTVTAADVLAESVTNIASAEAGGIRSNTATVTVNPVGAARAWHQPAQAGLGLR